MNLTLWYAVSIAAISASLLLYRIGSVGSAYLMSRFYTFGLKHLSYPLIIQRGYCTGVTRLQLLLVGSYFTINGVCMGLGIRSMSDLMIRSGTMASINLIPLFLGGRTNVLANFLGISLHTYYLAHHWVGRVVIIQGLLHVGLAIASGRPWTFNSSQISGISAASASALIFLTSIYFVRILMFEFFLKFHIILAFITVIALLNHLLPSGLGKSMFPVIAMSLWGFNTTLRLARMAYHNVGGRRFNYTGQVSITPFFNNPEKTIVSALRMTVRLRRPIKILPGQYVYLFLSDMGVRRRFQAHPYVMTWWDNSTTATDVCFLVQPEAGISSALTTRNLIRSVVVDGPYGVNLHLEKYETVILIAKGIGIAGLLPYVRHMTYRRVSTHEGYRRGLITRKIDVYWVMDDNCQEDWLAEWLLELQKTDSERLILTFTCFYPHKKSKPPPSLAPPPPKPSDRPRGPQEPNPNWRFIYNKMATPIIEDLMVKQVGRSAGRAKVAVCGTPRFSSTVRAIVVKHMANDKKLEFVEVEFQPKGVRQGHPGIHNLDKEGLETESISMEMHEKPSRLEKTRELLIKTRSGAPTKLKRVEEVDEPNDMDEKSELKEIV